MCVDILIVRILVDMYQKISRERKENAVKLTASGIKSEQAAKIYNISARSLRRAKQKLRQHGDVDGEQKRRGPPPSIGPALTEVPFYLNICL